MPAVHCFVPGCTNSYTTTGHRIPVDSVRRKQWILAACGERDYVEPASNAIVCPLHFSEFDYHISEITHFGSIRKRKFLRKNSVPSRFPWTTEEQIRTDEEQRQKAVDLEREEIAKLAAAWEHRHDQKEKMEEPSSSRSLMEETEKEVSSIPGDQMLQLPLCQSELDDFILSVVNRVVPISSEEANKKQLVSTSVQISKLERQSKDISKTLNHSMDLMKKCLEDMKMEEKDIEKEIDRKERMLMGGCEVIDDDSDDDVCIIGSSFDSSKRAALTQQTGANRAGQPLQQPGLQTPGADVTSSKLLANSRAALTNFLNRQVSGTPSPNAPVRQRTTTQTPEVIPVWAEIGVGSKVLAKKFNDIWYSGIIADLGKPEGSKNAGEWKFRVRFDGKGLKVLSGRHIAYRETINPVAFLKVGTRVAALYRDDESTSGSSFYAGIVAEAPSFKNQKRFLVFFDDGYAQYCWGKELHKVYYQSENVWEDIHPDSQEFIKEYLKQYPERPMVRLMNGQIVKTEWNGRWWTAKVMEVDASLVKMYFQADKRTEWIYRGSTRLEPLFKALANAEAIKAAGTSKGRRLNMDAKGVQRKPTVEYTRGLSADGQGNKTQQNKPAGSPGGGAVVVGGEKKRPVAKKSTGGAGNNSTFKPNRGPRTLTAEESFPGSLEGWEAPWLKMNRRQPPQPPQKKGGKGFEASSISSNKQGKDMASVLQERLSTVDQSGDSLDDGEALGERLDTVIDTKGKERKQFVPHTCSPECVKDAEEERDKHVNKNPLLFPLLCGWERQVTKIRPQGRKGVIYRAPCGRRLRCIEEVDDFLAIADSQLFIDHFCFDPWVHVHTEFVPVKTFCDIKDLSYGKENVPISCVNAIDRQYPDYVEYSSFRMPAKGVTIPLDDEFLQCCDCTDNCRDSSKCACQQLTMENTTWIGERDPTVGYNNRRLTEPIFTGVVECNARCKCDRRCRNRVAQNGLTCRLQVFKTEKRGWGLRCLNDLPKGGFICIYAGQLLTDMGANDDGKQYGDEYLAELDFIEVVERQKEGYESDVEDPDGDIVNDNAEEDDEDYHETEKHEAPGSSDSDFEAGTSEGVERKVHATRRRNKNQDSGSDNDKKDGKGKLVPLTKLVLKRQSTDGGEWTTEKKKEQEGKGETTQGKTTESGEVKTESGEVKTETTQGKVETTPAKVETTDETPIEIADDDNEDDSRPKEEAMETDELPDLDKPEDKPEVKAEVKDGEAVVKEGEATLKEGDAPDKEPTKKGSARKSTGGSRFKNLPNPKMAGSFIPDAEAEEEEQEAAPPKQGTRTFFKDTSSCYIMDAKSMGNIGRYLNHSCCPNVFVQNIFVDTHDLRFPWVAFFAGQYIRAGTELTWDYNYEVGSVPDKVLYCYCGSSMCRGRLL